MPKGKSGKKRGNVLSRLIRGSRGVAGKRRRAVEGGLKRIRKQVRQGAVRG